jgi:hypothetical protein
VPDEVAVVGKKREEKFRIVPNVLVEMVGVNEDEFIRAGRVVLEDTRSRLPNTPFDPSLKLRAPIRFSMVGIHIHRDEPGILGSVLRHQERRIAAITSHFEKTAWLSAGDNFQQHDDIGEWGRPRTAGEFIQLDRVVLEILEEPVEDDSGQLQSILREQVAEGQINVRAVIDERLQRRLEETGETEVWGRQSWAA